MLKKFARMAALACLALVAACATNGPAAGQLVLELKAGDNAKSIVIPQDGIYAIYSSFDNAPKYEAKLHAGEKFAFERAGSKVTYTVGAEQGTLPAGNYRLSSK